MAKKGKISELYDIGSLEAQQKTVIGLIDIFLEKVNSAKPIKVQLEGVEKTKDAIKGITELSGATQEYINISATVAGAQEKLKKSNKDLGDSFANVGAKINSELGGSTENAVEKLLKLTEALKANKKIQQELQSQKDTFSKMNQDLPEVAAGIADITKRQRELKEEELVLRKNVSDTNKEIRQRLELSLVDSGTREEVKATIKALKELRDTTVNINTDEGQAKIAELNQEIDRLNKILEQTGDKLEKRKINIGNYPGAVKVLESALTDVNKKIDDFTNSGNKNEEMLQALSKEQQLLQSLIENQANGFATLNAELKENENALLQLRQAGLEDSEAFKVLFAEVAKAKDELQAFKKELATRGSGELFLEGTIQAAQTLASVYGIAEGAAALFGDENEELQKTFVKLQAVIAILNGLEALNNAIKKENALRTAISVGLEKVAIAQKHLATAAESKNIIVKYAAIAAQKALNIATSAAGGPILILIGLLAAAVTALASYGDGAESAAEKNERLKRSLERTNKAIEESSNTIKKNGDKVIAQLEDNFATEEQLRKQREESLQEEIENIKKFNAIDASNRERAIREVQRLINGKNKHDKEEIDKAIEVRDGYLANLKLQADKERELELLRLENSRATKEDLIKAQQDELDISKLNLQTRANIQNQIVSNERKSYDQRRAALQEFQRLQSAIIERDKDKQLLVPTLTPSQRRLIIAQAKAAQEEINRATIRQRDELNRQELERERKARFEIIKIQIEDEIRTNDLIASNELKSFNERTDALYVGYEKRRDILIAQHEFDINNHTLTAEERVAIERKFLSDINQLTIDYGLQQQQIYQQNQDAVDEIITKGQQGRQDKISGDLAKANTELIKQLVAGQISLEQFSKQREIAERNARIESLKEEINNATAKVLATKEGTAERFAAEKELREKTQALNEQYYAKEVDAITKLNDLKKELAVEAVETFNSLVNSQFDNEAARIQQAMGDLEKRKEKEIEIANATIINKQEREAAITEIEARAQADREQLEQRQRQIELDRARFEKASNIAQIISTTALAVIKTFKDYPGPQAFPIAAVIGGIGALQLARAIAAPLPKFKDGTEDAPGGLSWVGDGGKKELVIEPSGKAYKTPSTPTIMDIPKHSVILPDADAVMRDLELVAMNNISKALNFPINEQAYGQLMTKAIENKLDSINHTIKAKHELHINPGFNSLMAIHKYGSRWNRYVNEKTKF